MPIMTKWTSADIPDQRGRVAIVTGANTGIGLETARLLAAKGAQVILACRSPEKGQAALARISADQPTGQASLEALDLADLDSVAAFAQRFAAQHARLDLLINNAGVMVPPLGRTKQGFELQIGTNHLGHFALTARLLPVLLGAPGARVVVVASTAANFGQINLDDLLWEKRSYRAAAAYAQSKLANQLFLLELSRKLSAAQVELRVTGAHPGWTATDLQRTAGLARFLNPYLAMRPEDGALPTLRAAVDPAAANGSYFGPSGFYELSGPPGPGKLAKRAKDEDTAAKLWELSERLTGLRYELAPVRGDIRPPASPPASDLRTDRGY